MNFHLVIWGDQCIIFRDQGSTDPPGGLYTDVGYNKKYLPTKLFQGTDIYVVRRIDSLPKPTIRESSKWSV